MKSIGICNRKEIEIEGDTNSELEENAISKGCSGYVDFYGILIAQLSGNFYQIGKYNIRGNKK